MRLPRKINADRKQKSNIQDLAHSNLERLERKKGTNKMAQERAKVSQSENRVGALHVKEGQSGQMG
jgi:hypothetical protein